MMNKVILSDGIERDYEEVYANYSVALAAI